MAEFYDLEIKNTRSNYMKNKKLFKIVTLIVIVLIVGNVINYLSTDKSYAFNITQNDSSNKYTYTCSNVNSLVVTYEYEDDKDKQEEIIARCQIGNKLNVSSANLFAIANNLNGKIKDKGEIEIYLELSDDSGIMVYFESRLGKSASQDFSMGNILGDKGKFKDYDIEYKVKKSENDSLTYDLISGKSTNDSSKFKISIKAE
jgi:hypothetical protein